MSSIIIYVRVILIFKRSECFKVEGENEYVSNKMSLMWRNLIGVCKRMRNCL